jgi:CubicO group peptidase (beta-lactamase class C family)
LEVFARERLFGPLGMKDTDYVVRDDMREQLLERHPEAPLSTSFPGLPMPGIESEEWRQMPNGGGGVYSTALDLAILGQTFLNGGTYGDTRTLSRPAVQEMTRDHCPGLGAQLGRLKMREASYGYGWMIQASDRWKLCNPSLPSRGTYYHMGAGGIQFWVDPGKEIVGVYFEVTMDLTDDLAPISWSADLFQNVVTSAVDD